MRCTDVHYASPKRIQAEAKSSQIRQSRSKPIKENQRKENLDFLAFSRLNRVFPMGYADPRALFSFVSLAPCLVRDRSLDAASSEAGGTSQTPIASAPTTTACCRAASPSCATRRNDRGQECGRGPADPASRDRIRRRKGRRHSRRPRRAAHDSTSALAGTQTGETGQGLRGAGVAVLIGRNARAEVPLRPKQSRQEESIRSRSR
jgi:hypothetical protein